MLSSDAAYAKFVCLPSKAQEVLKETGDVPWHYLRARETLHGSLQQLMYCSTDKEDSYKELTESNVLRTKIEFVQSIFTEWVHGGGIGCFAKPTDWGWTGAELASNPNRHDWSSVGRYGGDVF
jgi:myosin-1